MTIFKSVFVLLLCGSVFISSSFAQQSVGGPKGNTTDQIYLQSYERGVLGSLVQNSLYSICVRKANALLEENGMASSLDPIITVFRNRYGNKLLKRDPNGTIVTMLAGIHSSMLAEHCYYNNTRKDTVVIDDTLPDSYAQSLGLQRGDVIFRVQGLDLFVENLDAVFNKINPECGNGKLCEIEIIKKENLPATCTTDMNELAKTSCIYDDLVKSSKQTVKFSCPNELCTLGFKYNFDTFLCEDGAKNPDCSRVGFDASFMEPKSLRKFYIVGALRDRFLSSGYGNYHDGDYQ